MSNKMLFKVWNLNRTKKTFIFLDDGEQDLYSQLILKASAKLDINGSTLVLEKDGTTIDESEILVCLKDEVLLLLEPTEIWVSETSIQSRSASTVTFTSSSSVFELDPPQSFEELTPVIFETNDNVAKVNNVGENGNSQPFVVADCNSEFMWNNFEIPWNKLTNSMIEELRNGIKNKATICHLVHSVINEMRNIKTNLPSKAIKIVAKKIIDKYPKIFRDEDEDGVVMGVGSHTLFNKLMDRNNYLNRPHKQTSKRVQENPVENKKRRLASTAGCSNWNPPLDDKPENFNSLIWDDGEFLQSMEKTYATQRKFVNDPTIEMIKSEWPVLLTSKGAFWHFKTLTTSNIDLLDTFETKYDKFLKLASLGKIAVNKQKEKFQQILNIILTYFKEDLQTLFIELPNLSDWKTKIDSNAPCVVKSLADQMYYVTMEKTVVSDEGHRSFVEAFKLAFSLYFVLNLRYPKESSLKLEFIQRYVLKIHPDAGNKSKKLSTSRKRILTLMTKLASLH